MIRNYFLTAWRNLKSNRLNSFINVAGLAVAFTVCILLFLMVHFEFSFDQFHKNGDRLFMAYNLSHTADGDEKGEAFGYPAAPTFKSEVPGIVKTTSVHSGGRGIRYKEKEVNKDILLVSPDFFSMFSFPVISGAGSNPLSDVGNVVLGQSAAAAVFGKEEAVGKTVKVKIGGVWKDLLVTAVLQDAPENSSLQFNILARIELSRDYAEDKNEWNHQNHPVYVQLAPTATQQQVEARLRDLVKKNNLADDKYMKAKGYRKDANGDMFAIRLAPYTSLHFDTELGRGATVSRSYLYILVLIAVVVLVIACFNFINLNVARAFTRAKEVGVRKTIGAGKGQIFFQLWTESFLLFTLALIIALAAALLLLKPFNRLFVERLTMQALFQPLVIIPVLAGVFLVSFMAGGYPAWLVARFKTVEVLKGKVSVGRSSLLRNGLITFQFVLASLLICSTIVIYRQFQYMRNAPLGFEQESVISIPVKNEENSLRYISELRRKLAAQPQVEWVSGSSANIGIGEDKSQSNWSIGFDYDGKAIMTEMLTVDYDFLETLGVKLLDGRSFSKEFPTDTAANSRNVIVTESMARQFGVKKVVGLSFYSDSSAPKWNIVGLIPDFHLHSLHEKLGALTLQMAKQHSSLGYIFVKVRTNNPRQAMAIVRDAYKTIEPDNTTNASYLTENTYRWYAKEERLSTLFCSAAVIAILLSCLGLFAIVSLVIGKRRKEIGVRKVLGASVFGITGLLSREFIRLVALAFIIATPIAWYFLSKWLQDFPYRIVLSWWIFPLAGVSALVIALGTISVLTVQASLANPVKSLRSE
ncbi:ABC transporter permease [Flavitalea sp. BT771]|uniref:ABC transporter permease n=1 Tax=Flavitalea sp. BT771 TaxID=3063329 RepID=UPI0026E41534|nr:ABC transporter permease [Flavitalea sp. BT771]MDO6434924.1 ABC transporter permease [Flavitalea sp. BT771]MDV6223824.1 ABC transporter permease [Flavitalea sp. BT771]